ncbi:MAG: DUF192 domain-containing protein [Patescibacteria group bacterium]
MIKYLIIFLALLIVISVVGLIFLFKGKSDYEIVKIGINGKIFEAEVADTALKRAKGLSGRKTLEENKAMLFIFTRPSRYNFWMVDMNLPLDIVWINGNRVVDISKNVLPPKIGELPAVVSPSMAVDKVLEIPAGLAEKYDIKIGDEVVRK